MRAGLGVFYSLLEIRADMGKKITLTVHFFLSTKVFLLNTSMMSSKKVRSTVNVLQPTLCTILCSIDVYPSIAIDWATLTPQPKRLGGF